MTTKMIESLRTEQITTEGMMDEGTGYGVETAALPAPSPRGNVQKRGEMGIIKKDGREFRLRGEGGILPHGSGSRRPPTMVGRPRAGAWRIIIQNPYATTPRGGTLGKIGSLGMMGADDGRSHPCRDATNLSPPPRTPSPLGWDL